VFGLHFHFLFSFSENCFHFQKINSENMFGLTFCFLLSRNKNTENAFSKGNVFLDLLKITFLATAFSFYPKLGSWFQLKTRFYYFQFLVRLKKYFHWKCFQTSNQMHFHHHFLFPVKIKTKNSQTKDPFSYSKSIYAKWKTMTMKGGITIQDLWRWHWFNRMVGGANC